MVIVEFSILGIRPSKFDALRVQTRHSPITRLRLTRSARFIFKYNIYYLSALPSIIYVAVLQSHVFKGTREKTHTINLDFLNLLVRL